jgi:hypothetical protein
MKAIAFLKLFRAFGVKAGVLLLTGIACFVIMGAKPGPKPKKKITSVIPPQHTEWKD